MKKNDKEIDQIIEHTAYDISSEPIDDSVVEKAAARVWAKVSTDQPAFIANKEQVKRIRSCADFQSLIPFYLHGNMSRARVMLLEDHFRECISCRKAFKTARTVSSVSMPSEVTLSQPSKSRTIVRRAAIAAVLVIAFGLVGVVAIQYLPWGLGNSTVQAATGPVYRVDRAGTHLLPVGSVIKKGERIRTTMGSTAVVRLEDGSLVEMNERTEFSVSNSVQGATIHLEQGNIIVQAAKQGAHRLFVSTNDCLVSVTGTIFSVNNGTKGSRVSVIDGNVRVENRGQESVLQPGNQIATTHSMERVSIKHEVAWSRDANRYLALLNALSGLRDDLDKVTRPNARYSSRLLDLLPEKTVFYMALPNLSATLADAGQILQSRIQQNPVLNEWWSQEQKSNGGEVTFNKTISKIREFGEYLGDEIVVSTGMNSVGDPDKFLVLADLRNASGFHSYLEQQITKSEGHVQLIDNPAKTIASAGRNENIYVWIDDDLLVASPSLAALQNLASLRKNQSANPFTSTAFHDRIAAVYQDGAGLVIAADLQSIINGMTKSGDKNVQGYRQLGLTSLKHLVLELKEKDGNPFNRAVVSFNESTHGISSWLAAPGPMGALEYISPDANLMAAFVVKNPSLLVADLFSSLQTVDAKAWQKLKDEQAAHGIDFREDFAAPLGGEFAFAIDGPLLPIPSWKLIFEVNDPARLQQSIERAVNELNRYAESEGKQGLRWEQSESDGHIFYTLNSADFGIGINYTYANGYLIVAPSRALIERALRYKESGVSLVHSPHFIAALPEDGNANFSALFYHNLAPVTETLTNATKALPAEQQQAFKALKSVTPATLAYAYAQNDQIQFSANTENGPFGLTPGSLLGVPGLFGLQQIFKGSTGK